VTPAEPAFPLPGAGDTVVLVVPPTMVVEYRMLLHASRAYSDHLHYLRLARWLERRGARVHLVDCPLDPDAVISFRGSRRAGPHTVEPLDLGCGYQGLSRESLRRRLESIESVRQVWISSQFTFDREPIHETVRVVRQACPDALLLLGGVYPTLCPEDALSTGVDHIHRGLLLAVEDVSTARVDWRSLVMLGRGCPNRCSFCSSRHTENIRHHIRAPDDILADIEAEEARGAGVVLLYHANLFARSLLGDALVVLSGLADRDVSPILYNGLEPRTVTPRVAEILYRAGVPDVTIPLQTLSREIAKDWSRREGLRDWRRAIDTLLEAGFSADQISTDVIVGHPDQSFEEAVRTACWVWSQGVTPLLNPYAATPRTPDALRHGDRFASMGLEEQHYLL